MKLNKIFQSVPVEIPDRSGFDLSHEVLTTAQTGTIIPVTTIECLPGDTISMGAMMKVTLPPAAVPFFGRVDAELVAAFIPNRLVWAGWQSFITQNNGIQPYPSTVNRPFQDSFLNGGEASVNVANVPLSVPLVQPFNAASSSLAVNLNGAPWNGPGSLASYLGFKSAAVDISTYSVNALPFLAYHKFVDDWCIDDNTMKPFFPKMPSAMYSTNQSSSVSPGSGLGAPDPHYLPFNWNGRINQTNFPIFKITDGFNTSTSTTPGMAQDDNTPFDSYDASLFPYNRKLGIGSLRQRCWAKDYFTTATPGPQAGAPAEVLFRNFADPSDPEGSSTAMGGFTIATLRAANALQKWLERNNISGTEYGSQILAHFGVVPPDASMNRSVLLGRVRTPIVVSSVENNSNAEASETRNPYGSVLGSAAGFASGFDKGSLVDDFDVKEHGYLMVFFTLIPHQYYNTGVDRQLLHRGVGDFAFPELAGIGDQTIFGAEIANTATSSGILGYQQRYCEYKHKLDVVSGLLADGQNLDVYALQRGFVGVPALGHDFATIPTNYLDQVMAVDSSVSGFSCIVDAYFDCSALRVLPEYSIPHL